MTRRSRSRDYFRALSLSQSQTAVGGGPILPDKDRWEESTGVASSSSSSSLGQDGGGGGGGGNRHQQGISVGLLRLVHKQVKIETLPHYRSTVETRSNVITNHCLPLVLPSYFY